MTINNLIISNLHLAEKLAKIKKRKLSNVSYDELKSAAYMGLVEAANKYNPIKNDNFAAFAFFRINGAIKDYLRELLWKSKMSELHENIPEKSQEINFDEIVENLPPTNKNIIKLYYIDRMKLKEIACKKGVHESRISQILSESYIKLAA